jgi:N-acetylmuramoyl-L-alanine amidase
VVVLDPGHGGANRGARNVATGRFEKDYTLDWALRTKPLLEQFGWQVVLTRTNDVDMSLPERVAVADRADADLFISLHFNSSATQSSLHGVETYWTSPVGLPSLLNRGFADNATQAWPNNAFDAFNVRLALRLHQAVTQRIRAEDRGVRHARFLGVLRPQLRPAALLEGGYLCNPREARRIADPDHRQLLAEGLADALREGPAAFQW